MSRSEKDRQKAIQEKCVAVLGQLLKDEDNKYCVDCDAKGPRWASWNLGIFLCIRCAGIHRNLGVHISKVRSVNLDSWTPEQVAHLQNMGNSRARAVYEANLPDNFRRPQTDSSLEAFIRAKYEHKKYIAKEWVPSPPPKPTFLDSLEEERKTKKEKKKTNLEILPRPSGSSVSPSQSPSLTRRTNETKPKSNTADLLALDEPSSAPTQSATNDDLFGNFLSAPEPLATDNTNSNSAPSPNANTDSNGLDPSIFAGASGDATASKKPLSNESILSLYGQMPAPQPAPQPVLGIPGLYVNQPQAGYPVAGYPAMVAPQQPNHPMQLGGAVQANNPFLGVGGLFTTANPIALAQLQQQMAAMSLMNASTGSSIPNPAMMGNPNMYPNGVPGIPQPNVMWGIPTAPAASNHPGHTLATNLWQ